MIPRGVRNNNPANIRKGPSAWVGMAALQNDPDFIQFRAPVYGVRALMKILITYYETYGLTTITQIITRFAPPTENNTPAYIADVAKRAGIGPDDQIQNIDDLLIPLAEVIAFHENGAAPDGTPAYWFDDSVYTSAKTLALS